MDESDHDTDMECKRRARGEGEVGEDRREGDRKVEGRRRRKGC